MKTAKVNFCVNLEAYVNLMSFELKKTDLDYPSYISGNYYFSLTDKEKKLYRLTNLAYIMQHSKFHKILDLNIKE